MKPERLRFKKLRLKGSSKQNDRCTVRIYYHRGPFRSQHEPASPRRAPNLQRRSQLSTNQLDVLTMRVRDPRMPSHTSSPSTTCLRNWKPRHSREKKQTPGSDAASKRAMECIDCGKGKPTREIPQSLRTRLVRGHRTSIHSPLKRQCQGKTHGTRAHCGAG